jgi:meiotically up-regulated gene 157 (Mug157) protein
MDDPGYPSLISLSFFGFLEESNEIYINTRKRILSNKNPYFLNGKLGASLGSAHTTRRNFWPLFTIMRGLTSKDENEIKDCIDMLFKSAEKTGFIHESVNIDNEEDFTRSWFAWANSFFGLFINHIIENYPHLLK